jgi:hypothetical protein
MKFKVRASYVSLCETIIEAKDKDEAWRIAKALDGGVFDTKFDPDDWQIDHVTPIEEQL